MRETIWEADDSFDFAGRKILMDPAVVDLPMMTNLTWSYGDKKLGYVKDFRLEDDGRITGEVEYLEGCEVDDEMKKLTRFGGFYKMVVKETEGKNERVRHAELVSVSLFVRQELLANPGAKIEE